MFESRNRLLLAGMAAFVLAGCAVTAAPDRPAEEIVLERAQKRWDALLAGDWATAYRYTSPGYRAVVSEQSYGNQFRGPLQWNSASARSAKCEDRRCTVLVTVKFRLLLPGLHRQPGQTDLEETWVLEDGNWFKFEAP